MKRNIILLTIIIISIFQASSSKLFTKDAIEKSQIHLSVNGSQTGSVSSSKEHNQQNPLWVTLFFQSVSEYRFHGRHEEDDHKTHFFHFKRISSSRLFYKLWCILVRMLVIISHVSVLLYAFKSYIHI